MRMPVVTLKTFADRCKILLNQIRENNLSFSNAYQKTMLLMQNLLAYIVENKSSAEGQLYMVYLDFVIEIFPQALKYSLLDLTHILEILAFFDVLLNTKSEMVKLVINDCNSMDFLRDSRNRIWQIIHSVIRRDVSLLLTFNNSLTYQTREGIDKKHSDKILDALSQSGFEASLIKHSSEKESYYISVKLGVFNREFGNNELDSFREELEKNRTLQSIILDPHDYKDQAAIPQLTIGKEIISHLRTSIKVVLDIVPLDDGVDKDGQENKERCENRDQCLDIATQWTEAISRIVVPTFNRLIHSQIEQEKLLKISWIACQAVIAKSCGFADCQEIVSSAIYFLAKRKIFPLDAFHFLKNKSNDPAHSMVMVNRNSSMPCERIKDMDTLNKEAWLLDPLLELSISARNYRREPKFVLYSNNRGFEKGQLLHFLRIENAIEANFLVDQIDEFTRLVNRHSSELPKQKPVIRVPKKKPSPNGLNKIFLLIYLIRDRVKFEEVIKAINWMLYQVQSEKAQLGFENMVLLSFAKKTRSDRVENEMMPFYTFAPNSLFYLPRSLHWSDIPENGVGQQSGEARARNRALLIRGNR